MNAVSVWDHRPTADELLEDRVARGWRPTPTGTVDGPQILGHAACRFQSSAAMKKSSYVSPAYVRGPAVSDSAELVAWLATQARRVRLPVVIEQRSPTQGYVGPLAIELDDTALEISLADRLRSIGGERCALWLEGRWTRAQGSRYVLAIVNVGERIEALAAATHAEAEHG